MKKLLILGILLGVVVGCTFLKTHYENVKAGVETPATFEEQTGRTPTVWVQGRSLVEPLAGIPYVQWIVTPLGFLAGLWYADRRGARLRAGTATIVDPHPGLLSNIIQTVANISKGLFEVGPDGSPVKRTWKTAVAGILAGFLTQVPAIHAWALTDPTRLGTALVFLTGLIMGLEKVLSNVLPVSRL